jgi:hypothetical protein
MSDKSSTYDYEESYRRACENPPLDSYELFEEGRAEGRAEVRAKVAELHRKVTCEGCCGLHALCATCDTLWPCDTAVACRLRCGIGGE